MKSFPGHKINLGLYILGERPDGFHDIETLFVPCSAFRDELEIVEADEFSIEIDSCSWNPANDLTARAYRLLQAEFGLPAVGIGLKKGIPVGAGLGGGSSDAAAALVMLNEMFSIGLDENGLAERAAKLGSDCPFFIFNRPMLGTGRGDILTDCPVDLSGYELRVEMPEGVSVSTKEAYAGVLPACPEMPLPGILALPVECWTDCLQNAFEPSVFAAHPEIKALKERFYADGAVYAAMSGSGAAVFGLFKNN